MIFLFMLVFIQQIGQKVCGPEHEADYIQSVKLSAKNLVGALDRLNTFVAVRFLHSQKVNNAITDLSINRICNYKRIA